MSEKIKVLHLTTVSGIGGAERMILDLIANIDAGHFSLAVASLYGNGPLGDRVRSAQIPYHDLGFANPVRFLYRLRQLLKRERFDLIQLHGDTAEVVARPLVKRFGAASLLSTVHGLASFASAIRNTLLRDKAMTVDAYISVSEMGKRLLVEKRGVPERKIEVIHPGMLVKGTKNPARRETVRRQLKLAQDDLMILTVANLRLLKGHFTILEAAAQLRQQGHHHVVFVFAGEDRSEGEVVKRAEALGVKDMIRFLGFQNNVYDYLNAADIFLLPSQSEGLPLSILEAMTMGVPVIATAVGGIPEIIANKDQGILLPPQDAPSVSAALRRLGDDPTLREAIGRAGRARVAAKFSLNGMVTHYQEIYQRLYDEKNQGH